MEDFPVRIVIVLAVILVALSSFPLLSQSGPGARPAAPVAAPSANVASDIAMAASVAPMRTRPAYAKPVGKRDSKAAGPDDRAVPRRESTARGADGKVILKSSKSIER